MPLPPGRCSWGCAVSRVLLCGAAVWCRLFCVVRGVFLCCTGLCSAGVRVPCCLVCCLLVIMVADLLPLALAAPFLLVSCGVLLRCAVLCGVLSCVVPLCVVVCRGLFFGAFWCRGSLCRLVASSAASCCVLLVVVGCPALPPPLLLLLLSGCALRPVVLCSVLLCARCCAALCWCACVVLFGASLVGAVSGASCCGALLCGVLLALAFCSCGGVDLSCGAVSLGALLLRAVYCGALLPCGAVLLGSAVLFPLLLVAF